MEIGLEWSPDQTKTQVTSQAAILTIRRKTVNEVAIDLRMRWFMKIIDRLGKRILCFSKLQIYVSALCHARNPVALWLCQFLTFRGDDTNLISADVPATPMHASRPISIDFFSVSQCYQRCFASMLNRAKIFWSCRLRLWLSTNYLHSMLGTNARWLTTQTFANLPSASFPFWITNF